MINDTLPADIESQLSHLELRHARHQQKMEDQKEAKFLARERHRQGIHKIKPCPILLR